MAVATPGAGKTTFALTLARELFDRGVVRKLTVVAPTDHLKKQWADAAAKVGIPIDPNFKNADVHVGRQYKGVALTYSQVANKPQLHARNTENDKTLVILTKSTMQVMLYLGAMVCVRLSMRPHAALR